MGVGKTQRTHTANSFLEVSLDVSRILCFLTKSKRLTAVYSCPWTSKCQTFQVTVKVFDMFDGFLCVVRDFV